MYYYFDESLLLSAGHVIYNSNGESKNFIHNFNRQNLFVKRSLGSSRRPSGNIKMIQDVYIGKEVRVGSCRFKWRCLLCSLFYGDVSF
jgi:hypothetical protein